MWKTPRLLPLLALVLAGLAGGCSDDASSTSSGTSPVCGDGNVDTGEQCDDGNTVAGDGCSATCTNEGDFPVCGNGALEPGEDCDDGNTTDGDGCSKTCKNEGEGVCGDGVLDAGEECDDGNAIDDDGCTACVSDPVDPVCGNSIVEAGEECDDGNTVALDGCENDCTLTPGDVTCKELTPLATGTCAVTAGDGSKLLVGTVLTAARIYRGGEVAVDAAGKITCVGCDCSASAPTGTRIECPQGVITAGLINTHDHITFTQNDPYTNTGERYEHRHDWRKGQNGHTSIPSTGSASSDEVRWGELRFLMGGATSTVGSGSATGFLRNLDKTDQEGLGQPQVDFDTFPLGDSSGTQITSGCAYPSMVKTSDIAGDDAYEPHVSEGIGASARNEFLCLSAGANDVVVDQSAFIHSIGLLPNDYALMGHDGTAVIWSPRSNITLYGDTAMVTTASRLGVLIALGTDWMPTGSMNLLRELRCADYLNSVHYDGYFSDRELWAMVTINAAKVTATDDVIGDLATGLTADIAIFNGANNSDYRAVIDAEPEDVALVMRGGKVLYGDDAVVNGIPNSGVCDGIDVCSTQKALCVQGDIGKSLSALEQSVGAIYPAFFCGSPSNEPSCLPSRPASVNGSSVYAGPVAGDMDGDGVADGIDLCPTVFSPIRPLDAGVQSDFDADGEGDACDPCPLNPNTTTCSPYDPADTDGDGVLNGVDNCPNLSNATQTDSDNDLKGDACDLCPMVSNPGNAACPFTIYEMKNGTVPAGSQVAVQNVIVTGVAATGFFVQHKLGDASYMGADYSGIYVYSPGNTLLEGDRISISGAVLQDYFGQLQLSTPVFSVDSSLGEALPDPVIETPANLATGGIHAKALEGVLVEVHDVAVTNIKPDASATNEFVVDGVLRVNDLIFLATPFPSLGDAFSVVRGLLNFRNNDSKIEPRSAADLVSGPPTLKTFAPGTSFSRVGDVGAPTFPTPLTVTLSSAALVDTFVAIGSSDSLALDVVGGGVTVLAGQTSAQVLVDALAPSALVTLTANLGAVTLMADVTVLDVTDVPTTVTLSPASSTIGLAGTATLTVTLDLPAPVGGVLVDIAITPSDAGTVPAQVFVPDNMLSVSFDYLDAGVVAQSVTAMATLGGSMAMATIDVLAVVGTLAINEVDYDQTGTDFNEFVEIYNGSSSPVDLATLALVLVNGANSTEYKRIDLSPAGTLAAGQFLVIGAAVVNVPAGALKINFAAVQDNVQNGAPDAMALIDTAAGTVIDKLTYEGSVTAGNINGIGAVDFVEKNPPVVSDSGAGAMCRLPDGVDTDDQSVDWFLCSVPTPGAVNAP